MKLSLQELQFIDNYLVNSGVEFIDIRYEIADHVATALESMDGDFLENFKAYMLLYKSELLQNNKLYVQAATRKAITAFFKTVLKPWAFIAVAIIMCLSFYFADTIGTYEMADNLFLLFLGTYACTMLPLGISSFTGKKRYAATTKLASVVGLILYCATVNIRPGKNLDNPWILFGFYSVMIVLSVGMSLTIYKLKKQYKLRYTN